jgi:hypothetical protein
MSLMLRQISVQMTRHLPRTPRTCAGCFSRNALAMLATSVLSTCFGFGALQRAESITSRGAGMNSISEILARTQQAAGSGPFSDPSDSHQSLERVSARDLTWLPKGKCDRPNSARRSLNSRFRQEEALLRKWQGICQSHSLGEIVAKPAKPVCSHV